MHCPYLGICVICYIIFIICIRLFFFIKDLAIHKTDYVENWTEDGGIYIDGSNFHIFLQKQTNVPLSKQYTPNDFQLTTLNEILNITLWQTPKITCEESYRKLVVKGDYVRLSEIDMNMCGSNLRRVEIYALHTVFIDCDIDAVGKRLELVILASKWFISGDRTLNLSGLDGGNFEYDAIVNYPRPDADDGFPRLSGNGFNPHTRPKASDGLPGKPGGNAGHFYGIGSQFINADRLQIFGKFFIYY